jgi:hypothetical protein
VAYANRLINKLFLYKYHFRTANRFAAILSYFYIIRAVSYIVLIKGKFVTVITLRHICHFETADAALLIQLYRKQIKKESQVFKPVTIEITFESKEELTLMNEMLSYDISVPELVFEQDEDLQQKLTELMAKIDRVIVESLKGFE